MGWYCERICTKGLLEDVYQRSSGGCVGVRVCYLVDIICAMLLEAVVSRFMAEDVVAATGLFDGVVVVGTVGDECTC